MLCAVLRLSKDLDSQQEVDEILNPPASLRKSTSAMKALDRSSIATHALCTNVAHRYGIAPGCILQRLLDLLLARSCYALR